MSVTSAATFVKKSVGWSIGLSVLMVVAGILAIASPLAAGIAIDVLVAWLLVFSGCVHLVFAWYTRSTGGFSVRVAGRDPLHFHRRVSAHASCGRFAVTDDCAGDVFIHRGGSGVCLGIHAPSAAWIRLAPIRWNHHSQPRRDDWEDVAVELGMGHRRTGGNQHAL
jgi:hypothetical protein